MGLSNWAIIIQGIIWDILNVFKYRNTPKLGRWVWNVDPWLLVVVSWPIDAGFIQRQSAYENKNWHLHIDLAQQKGNNIMANVWYLPNKDDVQRDNFFHVWVHTSILFSTMS